MRTLVIDSATAACSAALFKDGECIAARCELIGRGHAERLVPMIGELGPLDGIDRIMTDIGPGSFTGVRIGVSVARALGFALGAQCQGFSAAPLMAAMAFADHDRIDELTVVAIGGHGEYFLQPFARPLRPLGPLVSMPFDDAARGATSKFIAGDAAEDFVARRRGGEAIALTPDAARWPLIAEMAPLPPAPLYVREPDARLPEMRR
ncbi:tRNA (adenosine(37)-N6)-threonylcarbamoyltransferase complex dimerization subunit type 1 TsaB [Novosphingopyxis sp.]|uniref:tRNA (adenosine(37)-N6)-threonylcarbamoyltransferase complex dimerization subunit type 1 TsaB n=1 Tax=Novosphingopyxis sp. TaxID=2709690 RepID=UPI003B5CD219